MSLFQDSLVSGQQTATGQGSSNPKAKTADMLWVAVDITAGTAITRFDFYLQWSWDGNAWYDAVADLALQVAATGAGGTVRSSVRNIVDNKSTTTAEKFMAVYKHVPGAYIRGAWVLNGTNVTFSATVQGK